MKKKDRIIHLDDMCIWLLKQWKIYVAASIIIAVLFGIIGAIKVQQKYSDSSSKNKIEVSVSDSELANVESVYFTEETLQKQNEYNKNSILMKIDPYHKATASVQYNISINSTMESETQNRVLAQVQQSIQEKMMESELLASIEDAFASGIDASYYRELITTDISVIGVVKISVMHENAEDARKVRDVIEQYIEKNQDNIVNADNQCEITKANETEGISVDLSLRDKQIAQYNTVTNLQTTLQTKQPALTDNENRYLELYREAQENGDYKQGEPLYRISESISEVTMIQKTKEVLLYAIKRVILALGIIVAAFAMKYMWSRRLMYAHDIEDMYGVRLIAEICESKPNSKAYAINIIKANLMTDGNNILASSNINRLDSDTVKKLEECLGCRVISVEQLLDMEYKKCNVLLVEQLHSSQYNGIEELVTILNSINVRINGAIILR